MNAAQLVEALGGAVRCGSTHMGWCPVHEGPGSTPSLSARDEGPRVLFRCQAGCAQEDVLRALLDRGLLGGAQLEPDPERLAAARAERERDMRERIEAALRIWRHTSPGKGSLVETYRSARGISLELPDRIRFANLRHGPSGRRWPAMVALVTDHADQVLGVHRTFLRRDGSGKADVEPAKMALGPIGGGAVRLAPVSPGLLIAEGIETALAASELSGIGAWAGLSAPGIRALELPDQVRSVVIAADRDSAGIDAARAAAERWRTEGREVAIELPAPGFNDHNDYLVSLRAARVEGFAS